MAECKPITSLFSPHENKKESLVRGPGGQGRIVPGWREEWGGAGDRLAGVAAVGDEDLRPIVYGFKRLQNRSRKFRKFRKFSLAAAEDEGLGRREKGGVEERIERSQHDGSGKVVNAAEGWMERGRVREGGMCDERRSNRQEGMGWKAETRGQRNGREVKRARGGGEGGQRRRREVGLPAARWPRTAAAALPSPAAAAAAARRRTGSRSRTAPFLNKNAPRRGGQLCGCEGKWKMGGRRRE